MSEGSQHKNKMYYYEVVPPEQLWNQIATALDESELTHSFPSTLYGVEIIPPSTAWEKITTSLDATQKPVQADQKRIPWFRYAAAAIILGLLVVGSLKWFSGNDQRQLAHEKSVTPVNSKSISPLDGNNNLTDTKIAGGDEARDSIALEDSKKTYANLGISPANRLKNVTGSDFSKPVNISTLVTDLDPAATYTELHYTGIPSPGLAHEEIKKDITDRYVLLMTPDGNIVRMSKKLGNLLCCVSGEDPDPDCKDQLQCWREKISHSSIAPSPGNFMDILDIVNSLRYADH